MRKLYTQYSSAESNTPFMVTFEGNQVQACANDGDTITIGSTEYVRVTDGQGHDVKAVIPNSGDETPHKLIVRLGEGNTHDLCYIENDEAASSTSIQVTDIQPAPQETVIEYTSNNPNRGYTTTYQGAGTIPENAYLTFEMVDRPANYINIRDYNVDYGYHGSDFSSTSYLIHAEGITADKDGLLYIPITEGAPGNERQIGSAQLNATKPEDSTLLTECIKNVTIRNTATEIDVEDISTKEVRTISGNTFEFYGLKSIVNSIEGANALKNLGNYLAFSFVDSNITPFNKTPVVKLHIPTT